MKRAFILLLDSFGIGAMPDAEDFGDVGANTLLHIAERCRPLKLPNLYKLGLNAAFQLANDRKLPGIEDRPVAANALYGFAAEKSLAKDTTSGHWEIMGAPVEFKWNYFPKTCPTFPAKLIQGFIKRAQITGILGDKHASGTNIINELGDEHLATGKPIVYTSADSVVQIAYHEEAPGGLKRLDELCAIMRELTVPYNVARVIARPFLGGNGKYYRTQNRHDYSLPPHMPTLLDQLVASGGYVIGIGKIPDIFAHRGMSKEIPAHGHSELFAKTLEAVKNSPDNSLTFTNFVDFDMQFGHRRDVVGYAKALEEFDQMLPSIFPLLKNDDIVIITADHGCDPTYSGSDHTREYIPVLVFGPKVHGHPIGKRDTFADIGQSLATYFGLSPLKYGVSFI